jgi:hypothetical protein
MSCCVTAFRVHLVYLSLQKNQRIAARGVGQIWETAFGINPALSSEYITFYLEDNIFTVGLLHAVAEIFSRSAAGPVRRCHFNAQMGAPNTGASRSRCHLRIYPHAALFRDQCSRDTV